MAVPAPSSLPAAGLSPSPLAPTAAPPAPMAWVTGWATPVVAMISVRGGLRAALAALDGRGPATHLTEHFRAIAGSSSQEWIGWIAGLDSSIAHAHRQLRSFAPMVVQAAASGDTVARSILNEAGAALANTAASALRKVGLLTDPEVATAGNVLAHSSCLRQGLSRRAQSASARLSDRSRPRRACPRGNPAGPPSRSRAAGRVSSAGVAWLCQNFVLQLNALSQCHSRQIM